MVVVVVGRVVFGVHFVFFLTKFIIFTTVAFMSTDSNTHLHRYHLVRRRAIQVQTADKFHIPGVCYRVPGVALPFVPMDDLNYIENKPLVQKLHFVRVMCAFVFVHL